ncbi:MAG TPA: LptA/OstA family protein [Micropepsaceae bacterium]|nr:LptA/OstA family protein [Micropepsaceae bacterium]
MMRCAALLAGLTVLLLVSSGHAAAPAPENPLGLNAHQPIAVNADSFLADLSGDTGTYTGNVIVVQGNVKLHADKVRVLAPGGRASRMEAAGHVVVDSPSGQAVGDTGIYDVPEQVLRLTGHVVLTKDQNVMRGTALEYSMTTGLAKMTAGEALVQGAAPGNTPPSPAKPGRVQGLFYPQEGSPQPGAAGAPAAPNPAQP